MASISLKQYKAMLVKPAVSTKADNRSKKATVTIGTTTFFARSTYEANIAAYYQFLQDGGSIAKWEHEPDTFWFEKIRRGVRSYLPDFKITRNDGTIYYVEVKGYMDPKSATKLKRMKKYHPKVELELIDVERYKEIKKSAKFIKQWGIMLS